MDTNSVAAISTARPTFFRALCAEAARGGRHTYEYAGYSLAAALRDLGPYSLDEDEWWDEIEKLGCHLDNDDDEEMWVWFRDRLPLCIALVPTRRRAKFIAGVKRAFEEGRAYD